MLHDPRCWEVHHAVDRIASPGLRHCRSLGRRRRRLSDHGRPNGRIGKVQRHHGEHAPPGATLRIDVLRWSSEAEREEVLSLIVNQSPEDTSQIGIGPDGTEGWPIGEPRSPLVDKPSLGYVWPSGSGTGYPLKYTHRLATPDGGQRITIVTGRPLGSEDRVLWTAAGVPGAGTVAFTVIQLQLNRDGQGKSKMSLAAEFAVDQEAETVTLADYDAAPVLLKDVTHEP